MTTPEQRSEDEVVDGCRQGRRWAQAELFARHHRPLYRFLVAQCGDAALAEDLVQETFIKVFRSIGSFRADSRVSSWMTRIALNTFYELMRRDQTKSRVLEQLEADPTGHRSCCLPPPSSPAERHELEDLVGKAIHRLSEADRAIILLHDLQGYRYHEIAEILAIAMGTVASRLSRARDRLRGLIRDISETPTEESVDPVPPTSKTTAQRSTRPPATDPSTPPRAVKRLAWSES